MSGINATDDCLKLTDGGSFDGKQGFSYLGGISKESAGAGGICMHLLEVPPGGRAHAHYHDGHETAIYMLDGVMEMHWGDRLQHLMVAKAGDWVYIPSGVPHLPVNRGDTLARAVLSRTDPNEQESVVLTPELEELVP